MYFGKRYLNTSLQRWVSADPLEVHAAASGERNLYAYVSGQALRGVDPIGLECGKDQSCAAPDGTEASTDYDANPTPDYYAECEATGCSSKVPVEGYSSGEDASAGERFACYVAGCDGPIVINRDTGAVGRGRISDEEYAGRLTPQGLKYGVQKSVAEDALDEPTPVVVTGGPSEGTTGDVPQVPGHPRRPGAGPGGSAPEGAMASGGGGAKPPPRTKTKPADAAKPKEGIYEFPDQAAEEKPYIGQSSNIPNRLKTHQSKGRLKPGTETTEAVEGGKTAREIAEHKRIQQRTGGVPARQSNKVSNKVDPIGESRKHLLKKDE